MEFHAYLKQTDWEGESLPEEPTREWLIPLSSAVCTSLDIQPNIYIIPSIHSGW